MEKQFNYLYEGGTEDESLEIALGKVDLLSKGHYFKEALALINERTKDCRGKRGVLLNFYMLKISISRCLLARPSTLSEVERKHMLEEAEIVVSKGLSLTSQNPNLELQRFCLAASRFYRYQLKCELAEDLFKKAISTNASEDIFFYKEVHPFLRIFLQQYLQLNMLEKVRSLLEYFAKTFYPISGQLGPRLYGEILIQKLQEVVWFGTKISMPVDEFVDDTFNRI